MTCLVGFCSPVQLSICFLGCIVMCVVVSEPVLQIARVVWKELRLIDVSSPSLHRKVRHISIVLGLLSKIG